MRDFLKVKELDKNPKTNWRMRHNEAVENPMVFERPIVYALEALEQYREHYKQRYDSAAEDDGVLSEGVVKIAEGVRILLNGEIGRLDAGTLDGYIVDILTKCGVEV